MLNFVLIQHLEILYTFLNSKLFHTHTESLVTMSLSCRITNPVSVLSVNASKKAFHAQHTSWVNCAVSKNSNDRKKKKSIKHSLLPLITHFTTDNFQISPI